jgi:hypothetical protein
MTNVYVLEKPIGQQNTGGEEMDKERAEQLENARLRDENTKLKLAYSALKRSIKLALDEYEIEVNNIVDTRKGE